MTTPVCRTKKTSFSANRILAGWALAALALLLIAPDTLLNDAARLAVLPIGGLALMALFDRSFCLKQLFSSDRPGLLGTALALTGAYFVMLSLPNLLNCPLFSEAGLSAIWWKYRLLRLAYLLWNWTGFLLCYVLGVYACLHRALSVALDAHKRGKAGLPLARPMRVLGLYPAVFPILIAGCCAVFSSAPSLFIGDAPSVWYGVRDGLWSEWHTAGYMLFVKLCSLVWNSQRAVTLVQLVGCVFIHNYAIEQMVCAGCSARTCRAYVLAVVVSFVPLYFLQVLIKDVVFSLSLFAFSLGILAVLRQEQPRVRDWLWLGAFGLGVCLFRHAGVLPVAFALGGLLLYFVVKRRKAALHVLLVGAGVALSSVLIVNVLAQRVLHFERNPAYTALSAPMTMIGAVAKSGEEIAPEDRAVMERIMPVEKWAACYQPYFADGISRPYGAIGDDVQKIETERMTGELLRLNWRFLTRHTKTYLGAFFNLNSLMWELATPEDGYVRSYLSYPVTPIAALVAAQGLAEDGVGKIEKEFKQAEDTTFTGLAPLVNRYAELLYGLPVTRCLFWRGGFANLALLFAAAVLLLKRRARALLALVPIALVTLAMLFSMPAQEVRYVFPNLLCAVFFCAYAFGVSGVPENGAAPARGALRACKKALIQ